MPTGRPFQLVFLCALAGVFSGCAQPGPLTSYRTHVGGLKTSLARMEFENEQLRRKVDVLTSENRDFEDRLVQEEAANGELSARLDDARNLLSRRGYELDEKATASSLEAEPEPRRNPVRRSNNKRRKPPFAEIPGRIDVTPPADSNDDVSDEPSPRIREDLGPQSRNDDLERWLPVARGTSEPTRTTVR